MHLFNRSGSATVIVLAFANSAFACPVCDSSTGQQVRAGLLEGNLGLNVTAVLLPFVILFGVTALIHFGFPGFKRNHGKPD